MSHPEKIGNLLVWGSGNMDANTYEQAENAASLPFLAGTMALMPDAHFGYGVPVGTVLPTKGAIIPYAVGVDIGCGMAAVKLDINASQLPDSLDGLMGYVAPAIPAGNGKEQKIIGEPVHVGNAIGFWSGSEVTSKLQSKVIDQCGTLGGGNHFFEVCLDENDQVWIVLHSGSRGIGNILATHHIKIAKGLMKQWFIELDDPNLAYLVENSTEFKNYIADMLWAQEYAQLNRDTMLDRGYDSFRSWLMDSGGPVVSERDRINCHHNFTQRENHHGQNMWITRKGAIKADVGDRGIIPGSMGAKSFIVEGRGNPASYSSCSHGAGRVLSRKKAKELFDTSDLATAMEGRVWNNDRAESLLDEIPMAYKDIDEVMAAQSDLVTVVHTLRQIFNYKG